MHDDTYTGSVQALPIRPNVNGHADAAAPDGRGKRIANRTPWLDLPAPFDNLEFRAWLDYPQEIAEYLTAPKDETPENATARMMDFFKGVILQHDGWDDGREGQPMYDRDGNPIKDNKGNPVLYGPLPQPDDDEFWERISTPLGRAIGLRFFEEIEKGNSRASRRANRKNWKRR